MDKENFKKIKKLYHYTSVSAAKQILQSKHLRFSKLKKMNDVNEAHRHIYYSCNICIDKINKELETYEQISFSIDNSSHQGYNINAMWGHYAEKGNGVCLVFDKDRLLSLLQPSNRYKYGPIQYQDNYNGDVIIQDQNIASLFQTHSDELFFTKTKDWSYEQEFRILAKTNNPDSSLFINYEDSLLAIIMYYAKDINDSDSIFSSNEERKFEEEFPKIPILELSEWFNTTNLRDKKGEEWEC